MITIAACLWQANGSSLPTSWCYDETWCEKLYRGFKRNLTEPFRFVVFTDRPRRFVEPIEQTQIQQNPPTYAALLEPLALEGGVIIVGLDTIVTGNVDHLAEYCRTGDRIAVPRDPIHTHTVCNGVVLAPAGRTEFDARAENDMDWFRERMDRLALIDDLFPGHVRSYRCDVKANGLGDTRVCFFHGMEKPHEIVDTTPWVRRHWN